MIEFAKLNTQDISSACENPPFNVDLFVGKFKPEDYITYGLNSPHDVRSWLEVHGENEPDLYELAMLEAATNYKRVSHLVGSALDERLATNLAESIARLTLEKDPNKKFIGTVHVASDIIDTRGDWNKSTVSSDLPKKILVALSSQLIRYSNMTDVGQLPEGIQGLLYRDIAHAIVSSDMDHRFLGLFANSNLNTSKVLRYASGLR